MGIYAVYVGEGLAVCALLFKNVTDWSEWDHLHHTSFVVGLQGLAVNPLHHNSDQPHAPLAVCSEWHTTVPDAVCSSQPRSIMHISSGYLLCCSFQQRVTTLANQHIKTFYNF